MSWFKTGYEATKDAYTEGGKDGDKTRRHWQPPETTQQLLFLDDDPFLYWEHNFKMNGHWRNQCVCLKRNKIDDVCAVCVRYEDSYPYFIGLHSVINLTPWTSKKGNTYCFQREIFAARLGGKDKPGVLKKLERIKKKHGRLKGLIFDVYRSGAKTENCGDEFELVEKIDPADIPGMAMEKVTKFVAEINANLEKDKQITVESLMKRNPWEPFNYEEEVKPKTNAELREMLGGKSKDSGDDASSFKDDGDSKGSAPLDDDIPY
jgi:hypothetical protein